MAIKESQALAILREELGNALPSQASDLVELGIGDDCAVLRPTKSRSVWTVDACSEGSHFLWQWMSPEDIAHKSFHAAISDVCAMGAVPRAAIVHLTLSGEVTATFMRKFAKAQARLSRDTKVAIVGGNICSGQRFGVVTSVMGESAFPVLRRDSAQVGDEIWLCGEIGLARAGLLLLEQGKGRSRARGAECCLQAFRRPEAQLGSSTRLLGRATACLDISDGLQRDAQNLAKASGVQLIIDEQLLKECLCDELVSTAQRLDCEPLQLALTGGEDYALLATGPTQRRPRGARALGYVRVGQGAALKSAGKTKTLRGGFQHT